MGWIWIKGRGEVGKSVSGKWAKIFLNKYIYSINKYIYSYERIYESNKVLKHKLDNALVRFIPSLKLVLDFIHLDG